MTIGDADATGEIERLRAANAELLAACEAIIIGRAIVRHVSERPEWLEALMPQIRKAVANTTQEPSP